ncbi:MAG: metal-sensitive transcriptional regulator [Bacillota bacterium]
MNSICGKEKNDLLVRLKRIEGQVRGLQRMINEEKYCVDILTQVVAVRGALKQVGLKVLEDHIHGCVQTVMQGDDEEKNQEIINELMNVMAKFTN